VRQIYTKYKISKRKIIKMPGMVASSYYRTPSFCKKGNKPSKFTFLKDKGMVSQEIVVNSVKSILSHEFIDCGYRIMTAYIKRDGYTINHKSFIE
jgi:putative transposase